MIHNFLAFSLVCIVIFVAIYISGNSNSNSFDNDANLMRNVDRSEQMENIQGLPESMDDFDVDVDANTELSKKFKTRNTSTGGYKQSSYNGNKRGGKGDELDGFMDSCNNVIQSEYSENDAYTGVDDGQNLYAEYKPEGGESKSQKLNDIFNSDNFLPQEKRDDWFEVVPDSIKAKDRHLINVKKHIGINTTGSSLKNPSYDLRGNVPCPKTVVSPWMQSSIEYDGNVKSLC
jgi:hypothetical protein